VIWSVAIRTVVVDDFLRQATGGGVDTVLDLGAGLETRPTDWIFPRPFGGSRSTTANLYALDRSIRSARSRIGSVTRAFGSGR
jgi:hypothetical protein